MRVAAAALVLVALASTGCGSSGSGTISLGAARTYHLAQFTPSTFGAGHPEEVSFTIDKPSGGPLTNLNGSLRNFQLTSWITVRGAPGHKLSVPQSKGSSGARDRITIAAAATAAIALMAAFVLYRRRKPEASG